MATDWPRFRGPLGNGKSPETELRLEWEDDLPPIRWKQSLGKGFGGAAVRDQQVFVMDREMGEADLVRCIDLDDGRELWTRRMEAPGRLSFPGSRTVPTVGEELVFCAGGFGHVYALERSHGELRWSVDLVERYDGELPTFGWSHSPLVVGDLVVVAALSEEAGLIAFDRSTGDEVWKSPALGSSHSTPVLANLHGMSQILFLSSTSQSGKLTSLVPEDGRLLWESEAYHVRLPIPAPFPVDDRRLFITGGYRAGSLMLDVAASGDGQFEFSEQFRLEQGAQIHMPILHESHLYVLVNENWNDERRRRKEGGLMCLDLNGQVRWRTGDEPFFGRGSMIFADGHLLIQDGDNGVLRVIQPNPDRYQPVSEANVFEIDDSDDHQMWGPMALSAGRLFMRSQDELRCLDLRPSEPGS